MPPLNYHHLYYFYITARQGSVAGAARVLHVTAQTISGQLTVFETAIGSPLFDRIGKRLHLNAKGKRVYQHAEAIFQKGHELARLLREDDGHHAETFVVGLTDAIPKVLAFDFLCEVIRTSPQTRFIFKEGTFDSLVSDIAVNHIDMVLADHGLPPGSNVNAISHFLGESHVSFFASPHAAITQANNFPLSLHQAPLLLPGKSSGIVQALHSWLETQQLFPHVVAEFDDSALLKLFGSEGFGAFCAPSSISDHVETQYNVVRLGDAPEVTERYYAMYGKNQQHNPLIQATIKQAKTLLD